MMKALQATFTGKLPAARYVILDAVGLESSNHHIDATVQNVNANVSCW